MSRREIDCVILNGQVAFGAERAALGGNFGLWTYRRPRVDPVWSTAATAMKTIDAPRFV
ncbi:hypothetical protein [Bradyrhizobium centrolobii]|uniref:hypothetical protein n=1 Tax=Bradyrhizobium centrolobii TaxID=1505087 RepID=UPI0013748224|nr:hypothetical protein [Bradyrhizobium centrolobii]